MRRRLILSLEFIFLTTVLMALFVSTSAEIGQVSIVPVVYTCVPDLDTVAALDATRIEVDEPKHLLDRLGVRGGSQAKQEAQTSRSGEQGNQTVSTII